MPQPLVIQRLHRWNLSASRARSVQERLRNRVRMGALPLREIRAVAGADIAVSRRSGRGIAAVVVLSFPDLRVLEIRTAVAKLTFPYVPGLLSFREIPVLIACLRRVKTDFDVLLCDAQGIAHPRRFGLASHLGLVIDRPTVGCAKSRLVGSYEEPDSARGSWACLTYGTDMLGSVLRTRDGVRPLFVSPGHRVDHPSSRRITLACCTRYRLPEPTRLAHIEAARAKARAGLR